MCGYRSVFDGVLLKISKITAIPNFRHLTFVYEHNHKTLMKITLAQLNYHIGNFDKNYELISDAISKALSENSDLIVFGELSTTGYPPRDFLEFSDFIDRSDELLDKIMALSTDIGIIVGAPSRNPKVEGKDLFNSAYFFSGGETLRIHHKTLLPTYDIFDEYRYFEPSYDFQLVEFKGKKIALTVCEDIWNIGNENPLYPICPLDEMVPLGPDFIINISASPFSVNHAEARKQIVRDNVNRYQVPMIYVNHVGAQTEILFDGGSLVAGANGNIYKELPYFEEAVETVDLNDVMTSDREAPQIDDNLREMHDAVVMGVRDYFGKLGFTQAILGLSGGIDSAVTAVIAARALGGENVRGVLMPSQFSSDHSVSDAEQLAKNLNMPYDIIPIAKVYKAFDEALTPAFVGTEFNVTEENIQARIRGILNMAISNKFGNILLNTSNKSEMAVGYGTLYGDLCGGLSVIGDIYKTDVYRLAEYINKDGVVIPVNTITKPPSAELRPNQKDSDSLPDYAILDEILYEYIENKKGPKEIMALGHEEALVKRILRMVNINEFKRYQTAPTLRVSSKSFGVGRRLPIVAKYLS